MWTEISDARSEIGIARGGTMGELDRTQEELDRELAGGSAAMMRTHVNDFYIFKLVFMFYLSSLHLSPSFYFYFHQNICQI